MTEKKNKNKNIFFLMPHNEEEIKVQLVGLPVDARVIGNSIEAFIVPLEKGAKVTKMVAEIPPANQLATIARFPTLEACANNWEDNPGPLFPAKLFRGCWVPLESTREESEALFVDWINEQEQLHDSLVARGLFEHDPNQDVLEEDDATADFLTEAEQQYLDNHFSRDVTAKLQIERIVAVNARTSLVVQTEEDLLKIDLDQEPHDIVNECKGARTFLKMHYWLGTAVPEAAVDQLLTQITFATRGTVETTCVYYSTEDNAWRIVMLAPEAEFLVTSILLSSQSAATGTLFDRILTKLGVDRKVPFRELLVQVIKKTTVESAKVPEPVETKDEVVEEEEEQDAIPETTEHDGFKDLPITQIVCNLTRPFKDARVMPCTDLGNKMAANFVRVAATKIFADPYQSIMELVSNAIDAETHNKNSIGRFGMGFFSIFALLLATKDFDALTVTTTSQSGDENLQTFRLVVVADPLGVLKTTLSQVEPEERTGTFVQLTKTKNLKKETKANILEMVTRFRFSESASILVNGKSINADLVKTEHNVEVFSDAKSFGVRDHGAGMSPKGLGDLLVPSKSSKGLARRAAAEDEEEETMRFRLGPAAKGGGWKMIICVNGVQVKVVTTTTRITAEQLKVAESIILMPNSTKLPVARDDVILSDQDTFDNMAAAFVSLIIKHTKHGTVVAIRSLVENYVQQSRQFEAFKLLEIVDRHLLKLKLVLIPSNNENIKLVCKNLGLEYVESDVFSVAQLENQVTEAAQDKSVAGLPDIEFEYTQMVPITVLKEPICKLPFLSGLVFVTPGTTAKQLSEFAENPSNGCMTANQLNARKEDGLVKPFKLASFMGERVFHKVLTPDERKKCMKRCRLIFSKYRKDLLTNAKVLWDTRFSKFTTVGLKKNFLFGFVELWLRVEMDLTQFDEVTSTLCGKLCGAVMNPTYGGRTFINYPLGMPNAESLKPQSFVPKLKGGNTVNYASIRKTAPVPDLELALLQHKVSLFPAGVSSNTVLPAFSGALNSFCSFVDSFESYGLTEPETCFLLADIHKESIHIVESYFITYLFYLYFVTTDKTNKEQYLLIIKRIRIELRQHVSLVAMLKLYADWMCGPPKFSKNIVANIINPIALVFPTIRKAVEGLGLAEWVSTSTELFNKWDTLDDTPFKSYKFSVNDLMMFAYSNKKLSRAEDLMKPDVLRSLDDFAKRENRVCPIQAVTVAVNYGNTRKLVEAIFVEVFQNSNDAINSSGVAYKRIEVGVNERQLSFRDYVGIKDAAIMSLLVPFFSEKSGKLNASGEMGTGFFNLFRKPLCDYVIIGTKAGKNYVKITGTPVVKDKLVVDIALALEVYEDVTFENGTEICLGFDPWGGVDGVDVACQVHIECMSKYFATQHPLFLNKQQINGEKLDDIYSEKDVVTVRGFLTRKTVMPSVLMINGVPFGLLADSWTAFMGSKAVVRTSNAINYPSNDMQFDSQFNLVFDVNPSFISSLQDRKTLVVKNAHILRQAMTVAQTVWLLKRYSKGKMPADFILNTESDGPVGQLMFYHGAPMRKHWNSRDWMPQGLDEFIAMLHFVIEGVRKTKSANEKGAATDIINDMKVSEMLKDALLFWFKTKRTGEQKPEEFMYEEEMSEEAEDRLIDVIIKKKQYTSLPVAECFIEAFLDTFNAAMAEEEIVLKSVGVGASLVAPSTTKLPPIGCVQQGVRFLIDGIWLGSQNILLLSFNQGLKCAKLLAALSRKTPEKLVDSFAGLVGEHLFTGEGSTIIHETLHCVFQSRHVRVSHSNLSLMWYGKETNTTFDGMTIELYNKLCERGINSRFLELLRKRNVLES